MWNSDVYAPHNPETDALYVSVPFSSTPGASNRTACSWTIQGARGLICAREMDVAMIHPQRCVTSQSRPVSVSTRHGARMLGGGVCQRKPGFVMLEGKQGPRRLEGCERCSIVGWDRVDWKCPYWGLEPTRSAAARTRRLPFR
nr:hypothetical protein [Alicyclobacillus contaminans]